MEKRVEGEEQSPYARKAEKEQWMDEEYNMADKRRHAPVYASYDSRMDEQSDYKPYRLGNSKGVERFQQMDSKPRNRTTPHQLDVLEKVSMTVLKPDKSLRQRLSNELGMTQRQVQIWFQNRRAKLKKQTDTDEDGTAKELKEYGGELYDTLHTPMSVYSQSMPYENLESYNSMYPRKTQFYEGQDYAPYTDFPRRMPYPDQGAYFDNNFFRGGYYSNPDEKMRNSYSYYSDAADGQRFQRPTKSSFANNGMYQPRNTNYSDDHYRK